MKQIFLIATFVLFLSSCAKKFNSYETFSAYRKEIGGYWVYLGKKNDRHHFRYYIAPWVRDINAKNVYVKTDNIYLDSEGKKLLSVTGEIPIKLIMEHSGMVVYDGPVRTVYRPDAQGKAP